MAVMYEAGQDDSYAAEYHQAGNYVIAAAAAGGIAEPGVTRHTEAL